MSAGRPVLAERAEGLEGAEGSGHRGGHGRSLDENEIGEYVLTEAIRIHRGLGPGLLESVYEAVLANALRGHGLRVFRQVPIPIEFEGVRLDEGFRVDLVVEGKVIVELKSVEKVHDAHKKQLLTYLKFAGLKLGYLLNFGGPLMKNGIHRIANGVDEPGSYSACSETSARSARTLR